VTRVRRSIGSGYSSQSRTRGTPSWQQGQIVCLADGDLTISEEAGYVPRAKQAEDADEKYGEQADVQILS
jgi:hypothetical protein